MGESSSERPNAEVAAAAKPRRNFRLPAAERRSWRSTVASVLLHALIIALVFMPTDMMWIDPEMEGAGGAGPAGGGGGGRKGTGGDRNAQERLQFYAAPQAIPVPQVVPPIIEKKPEVVPPPVVQPPPVEAPKVDTSTKVADATEVKSPVTGTGGGTGNDTTGGTGPGTGGGMGSGNGTGKGSADGPGTGGGSGTVYPPHLTTMVILPLPVPSRVRPYEMRACFEVDSLSRVKLLYWTKSKDANYNKRVEESLLGYKFRAAVRASDGQPVRDTACVTAKG